MLTQLGSADLLIARWQMAFTLGWHIIVACLGVGLPIVLLFAEWRALRGKAKAKSNKRGASGSESNDSGRGWEVLARRWSKSFAVLFAVGAVSGTVLSFELGLLWPEFMGTFGSVIGLAFTTEAFAFFLEAIFIGIYLYGWDRLPPRVHWLTGFPIAIAGLASAWFVVTANAWMQVPEGFRMQDGVVVEAEPIDALMNAATWPLTIHMIIAAYIVSGFLVASYYAVARLRGHDTAYHRRAMAVGLTLGLIFVPVQILVGDWVAETVATTQPLKLAAMEGQFATEAGAPLRIGGFPDVESGVTRYAIEIPGALSWLAYGDVDAVVKGLEAFPRRNWPPIPIVHYSFQMMVGIGTALLALGVWAIVVLLRRRRLPRSRAFLAAVAAAGPLSVLAMEAGWVVTEVGRQPWIVYEVMHTSEAVTDAPGLLWVFAATITIYLALTIGAVIVLRLLARQPLPDELSHDQADPSPGGEK